MLCYKTEGPVRNKCTGAKLAILNQHSNKNYNNTNPDRIKERTVSADQSFYGQSGARTRYTTRLKATLLLTEPYL